MSSSMLKPLCRVEPRIECDTAQQCHELVGLVHDRITALRIKRDRGDVGAKVDLIALEQELAELLFCFSDVDTDSLGNVEPENTNDE